MTNQLMPFVDDLNKIQQLFDQLSFFIEAKMKRDHSEITFLSELFLEELLNEIFKGEYSFINLNFKKSNYPAIDLGDEKNGISFQITVTNDRYDIHKKIKKTLEKFYEHELDKTYSKLYIFIATGFRKENDLKIFNTITCEKRGLVKIEESLFSNENIWDFSNLYNYIQENQSSINLDKVISICKKVDKRPELIKHDPPTYHIPRITASSSNSTDIIQIIREQKQVVLIGEGGLGKTTELKHVVHVFSHEGWYCYLIRMVDYAISLNNTINTICPLWYNYPESEKILFAFDGLDEIEKEGNCEIINEIVQFGFKYPNIHIIVSHKKGYRYDFRLDSNNFTFYGTELSPISKESVIDFITNENNQHSEYLIKELEKKQLFPLVSNPFYLIGLLDIFNKTGKIPNEAIELLELLIDLRIKHESQKSKSHIAIKLSEEETEVYEALKWVALIMQFANKNSVSQRDLQKMVQTKLRKFMPRLVLVFNNDVWKFEHSLIRDYLAALSLLAYNWDQTKEILLTTHNKIKPQWNNSFWILKQLASKSGKSEIVKQLNYTATSTDHVKLLKSSDIQLSKSEIDEIFKSIFNDYKKKEIVFYAEFSADDLARFCDLENNSELIEFLLLELKPEMNIQNLRNIVELFLSIKPTHFIERIATALSGYLAKDEYAKYSIHASILEIYTNWNWNKDTVLKSTVADNLLIQDGTTRSKLIDYHLAVRSPYISADFILRCLKIRQNDRVHTFDISAIKEAISALEAKELMGLLEGLTLRDENDQSRKQKGDFIEVVKAIEERATILYPTHNEIVHAVNKFVSATLKYVYRAEPAWAIRPFYEKNDLVFSNFKTAFELEKCKLDEKLPYLRFKLSAFFFGHECSSWLQDKFGEGKISKSEIFEFRASLNYHFNFQGVNILIQIMNEITEGKLFPLEPDPYTETRLEVDALFAKAILNKELYIQYIENAYSYFEQEEITWEEYCFRKCQTDIFYNIDIQLAIRCMDHLMDHNKATAKHDVLFFIEKNNNWETLQLQEHYELSTNQKLLPGNIEWIKNWCKQNELKIDFKNALTDNEDGGMHYTYWAVYYIQFCLGTGYHSENKNVLKDLIWCLSEIEVGPSRDGGIIKNFKLYDYLKVHLSIEEINEQIVTNLESGEIAKMVLQEYINIAAKEKIVKAAAFLPQYILNEKLDKWTRYKTLKVFFELGGRFEAVQKLIDSLHYNQDESADWYIIDELIQQNKSLPAQHLIGLIGNEQINQYKLALRLIKCGKTEGLDILCSILKEKNSNANYEEFRRSDFEQFVTSGDFAVEDIVPRLENLLLIHLQPEFKLDEWSNLIGQLFNLLAYYFPKDKHGLIVKAIEKIEEGLSNSKNTAIYQIIYRNFQKTKLDLNIQEDKETDIGEAIEKLKRIGVCH